MTGLITALHNVAALSALIPGLIVVGVCVLAVVAVVRFALSGR